jgi:ATP-dependent RNA helicase DDX52/ROK1
MQAIPALLGGRELLACAPTGSGKTAAFVIPTLQRLAAAGSRKRSGVGPRAVLVAPTQELARQTHREVLKLSQGGKLSAALLTRRMVTAAQAQERGARGGGGAASLMKYDLVVSTPLRLVGLVSRGLLPLDQVTTLVLDEADKLLDLGFLEQVDTLLGACTHPDVARALFSATMMPAIEQLADTVLRQPVRVVVGEKNAAADTVDQSLVFVGREDGKVLALRQMIKQGVRPPVLVFVQSKERAVQLFHQLVLDGLRVDVIHSDRTQAQRDAVVDAFRLGKVWVLIATELMARGMDFKGVQLVVNFDFPQTTVSYIHRIGRTGRAGMTGKAVTFFTEEDVEQLRSIANVMKASGCPVPDWMLRLQPMHKQKRKQLADKPRARKAIFKKSREEEGPATPRKGRAVPPANGGEPSKSRPPDTAG